MTCSDHVRPLYDQEGNLYIVQISAAFWDKYKYEVEALAQAFCKETAPAVLIEPLHEWEEFLRYWDFKYPITAEVICEGCGASTQDWRTDPVKSFRLKSAQLGGLAVFHCNQCGGTVRKKHFKDHICYEYTATLCNR